MPRTIGIIPGSTHIVDKDGGILTFFRLRWEEVRSLALFTPTVADLDLENQTAAIPTTNVFTALTGGWYRLNVSLRKTIPDGVSSSLTLTIGWTDHGTPMTETEAALTLDTNVAQQTTSKPMFVDANAPITVAVAYASNTPAKMTFNLGGFVENMA